MEKRIGIFGTSGFAREVSDICFDTGYNHIVFLDKEITSHSYLRFPVLSEKKVRELFTEGFDFAIGIGDNAVRRNIRETFPHLNYPNVIHPSASFGYMQKENFELRAGNIVAAGVRFTNNINLGSFGIYNLNCTIGHDCIIDDYTQISPGANISGNVHLMEGASVGTNACILQGKSSKDKLIIGDYAIIGAGAVVIDNVFAYATVVGVPAKPIK